MAGVAARYGETGAAASYLLPISVDGLVVVASISLVEIAGRIRTAGRQPQPATASVQPAPAGRAQPGTFRLANDPVAATASKAATASPRAPLVPSPAAATVERAAAVPHFADTTSAPDGAAATRGEPAPPPPQAHDDHRDRDQAGDREQPQSGAADGSQQPAADDPAAAGGVTLGIDGTAAIQIRAQAPSHVSGPDRGQQSPAAPSQQQRSPERPGPHTPGAATDAGKDGDRGDRGDAVVPSDTAAAVAYWSGRDPSLRPADIAVRIGRSERTVRRYWPPTPARRANGHDVSSLADHLRVS